jgi:3D (Asp-Asp-Asp) domain-containing protein
MSKPLILVALTRAAARRPLTSAEASEATAMIEQSDNAAAAALYREVGLAAIDAVAADAGMRAWRADTSDPVYPLGESRVSAEDFARFFARIDDLVAPRHRSFARQLLSGITGAGAFGVLRAGIAGTVLSKGGWMDEGDGWTVNQAAQFEVAGRRYGFAVVLGRQPSFAAGAERIAAVAQAVRDGLSTPAEPSAGNVELPPGTPYTGPARSFEATAYGPPWNEQEGSGVTKTEVRLPQAPTGQPGPYIIAVDPAVIPLHTQVYVWPNPFGYRGRWQAEDTGGEIDGSRLDFLDLVGREHQLAWGRRTVTVSATPPRAVGGGEPVDPGLGDPCGDLGADGPLPLTRGQRARLLPNGMAAAPRSAPAAVKRAIAAGNEIVGKPYVYGGGHGLRLSVVADAYDCSSSVGHLLWGGGLVGPTAQTSGELEAFGRAGYGKWVSVLANADHVYVYVAGLRWDTHLYGGGDHGSAGIGWHTAQRPDVGFVPRHPAGL